MNSSSPPLLPHRVPGNDAIRLRVEHYDWGLRVTYVGPSLESLHIAGCLSDSIMLQLTSGIRGRGGKYVDENGDGFRRTPRKTKAHPNGIEIIRCIDGEPRARMLPGVADYIDERRRDALRRVRVDECRYSADASVIRLRSIGRHQRWVSWTVEGKLILPDWRRLRRELLAARAP